MWFTLGGVSLLWKANYLENSFVDNSLSVINYLAKNLAKMLRKILQPTEKILPFQEISTDFSREISVCHLSVTYVSEISR